MPKKRMVQKTKTAGELFLSWLPLTLFFSLLVMDQYTKWAIRSMYVPLESHPVFPFLSFTYLQNTGTIWGLFQSTAANGFFVWLSIIAFGFLLYTYDAFQTPVEKSSYALLMAGLWGNFLDRISVGFVVDFIDLGWWPVFNIADSCINLAIILILIEMVRKEWQTRSSRESKTRPSH